MVSEDLEQGFAIVFFIGIILFFCCYVIPKGFKKSKETSDTK